MGLYIRFTQVVPVKKCSLNLPILLNLGTCIFVTNPVVIQLFHCNVIHFNSKTEFITSGSIVYVEKTIILYNRYNYVIDP